MRTGTIGFFVTLVIVATPALAEWEWQNPLPQGNDLLCLWARSATDIHAGGYALMHYDGVQWTEEPRDPMWIPRDMWGVDTGEIYAVGYFGLLLVHDGSGWSEIPTSLTEHLSAVWAPAANDVYAAGFSGNIYHFDGVDFSLIVTAPDGIHDLWGSGPDDIWAAGFYGLGYHYDGVGWTEVASASNGGSSATSGEPRPSTSTSPIPLAISPTGTARPSPNQSIPNGPTRRSPASAGLSSRRALVSRWPCTTGLGGFSSRRS